MPSLCTVISPHGLRQFMYCIVFRRSHQVSRFSSRRKQPPHFCKNSGRLCPSVRVPAANPFAPSGLYFRSLQKVFRQNFSAFWQRFGAGRLCVSLVMIAPTLVPLRPVLTPPNRCFSRVLSSQAQSLLTIMSVTSRHHDDSGNRHAGMRDNMEIRMPTGC